MKRLLLGLALISMPVSAQLICKDGSTPYTPTPVTNTVSIANDAAMDAALLNAKGGEHFLLADGQYSLALANKAYTSEVVLEGGPGAVFSSFASVKAVTNLTIKGVTFQGKPGQIDGTYLLKPESTTNLKITGVHFSGVGQSMVAIYPKTGQNVNTTIDSSVFSNLADGAFFFGFKGLTVTNNEFYGLGADTMKVATSSSVLIGKNHVHDAIHNAGSHPDFLQLQGGNKDVTIEDNLIEGATQGIDNFGFSTTSQSNIVVRRNTHRQGSYPNFVGLFNVTGSITDNVVYKGTGGYPLIRYSGGITASNNQIK